VRFRARNEKSERIAIREDISMSDHIEKGAVKIIEVIGVSQESFEDAVQQGVMKASESVKGISGVEVMKYCAQVRDGKVTEFHANMKLAFAVQ